MLPLVAIVGRPNVGKSTLFNRLVQRKAALVAHESGLTRDRHYGVATWDNATFQVVDTGGLETSSAEPMQNLVRLQTESAIEEADLLLLVLDGREGPTATDIDLIQWVRRSAKPTLFVVNKVDGPRQRDDFAEFHRLGLASFFSISAEHGLGFDDLIETIVDTLAENTELFVDNVQADAIRVALIGRPNAGKSALLNCLVGKDRAIVSDIPGTTRDPIDVPLMHEDQSFVLVDTAGIRRKRRAAPFMEQIAVLRAQRCIADAHVACLLIDADAGIRMQDAKIAHLTMESGRGLVLVFTKQDLLPQGTGARKVIDEQCAERLAFAEFAPRLFVSSLTGKNVAKVLPTVQRVAANWKRRIKTAEANRLLEQIVTAHRPPSHNGRPISFLYATQASTRPPTFVIKCSHPKDVPESYLRYISNRLRDALGFAGSPIRIILRPRNRADRDRGE